MRISQKTEWAILAVLVAYIAFTPGVQAMRDLLSTGVGKAVYLGAVVAAWKFVSPLVAVLLVVNFVRCASMREFADDASMKPATASGPPPNTHCPDNYTFDNGQCKNKSNPTQTIPASVCLEGQTWDGNKCTGSSSASAPPPTVTPPPSTSSTTMKQPFTNMTPAVYGGVQPVSKETTENFAPA